MPRLTSQTANRLLWTAQILLALLFLFAGVMKLVMPVENMQGPIAFPLLFLRFIGLAETLGALGLILPGLLSIKTHLAPLAASGLATIMAGATAVTAIWIGLAPAVFPLVVGLTAATIAYGRSHRAPRRQRSSNQEFQTA